jgi:hypothetical protein
MKKTCFENFDGHICGLPVNHTGEHICAPCKIKQKRDQDGSFQSDPILPMGERLTPMNEKERNKDLCQKGHLYVSSDSCQGCGIDMQEALDEVIE